MATSARQSKRHNAYRRLSRLLFPQSYLGKILLLTFVAAHIPLLALVVYTVFVSEFDTGTTVALLLVGLGATLMSAGLAMAGLWILLTPVVSSSLALERYRRTGARIPLPIDVEDEGGRLLANVHGTLEGLDRTIARLEAQATRDDLTGVYNRREGARRLRGDLDASREQAGTLALILLDADHLKAVNDQWGHHAGDRVLRRFAEVLSRTVDGHGWVSRWGGDEFVAVVRESGDRPIAERLLGHVLDELARSPLRMDGGEEIQLRLSAGVAHNEAGDDVQGLFNRADAALYRTKRFQEGRPGTSSAGAPGAMLADVRRGPERQGEAGPP